MGLDMTYGLKFKNENEAEKYFSLLENSFKNTKDFYIDNNTVSIYYRLNWNGVRHESRLFNSLYIMKNLKKVKKLDDDKKYIFVEENKISETNFENLNSIYLLDDINNLFNENIPFSPVSILSLGFWKCSNGESFSIKKEGTYISVYRNEEEYIEVEDNYRHSEIKLFDFDKEVFMKELSERYLFLKEVSERNESYEDYIMIKTREIMFFLKYFMYNDVELHSFMG